MNLMKKELALIIAAVVDILLIYPFTLFSSLSYGLVMILMLPLLFVILYSTNHAVNLLHSKERKKAIIFVGSLVAAVIVSSQVVMLMIASTIRVVA